MIIPAIITQSDSELKSSLKKLESISNLVQLDIMDRTFVQNSSLDFDFNLSGIRLKYEVHLMIRDPMAWIIKNYKKVDTILFHIETTQKPDEIIKFVKNNGKKVGLVLIPETPFFKVIPYLNDIDQLLIMTVNPGYYGSPFLPEMAEKVHEARKCKADMDIEVDGGITPDTIKLVFDAGANMFVSGSFILKSENMKRSIEQLVCMIE